MNREDDKAVLAEARPFVRSVVALVIYAFRQVESVPVSYKLADEFLAHLEKDLSE